MFIFKRGKQNREFLPLRSWVPSLEHIPGWAWRTESRPACWSAGGVPSVSQPSWSAAYPVGHSVPRTFVLLHPVPLTLSYRHPIPPLAPRWSSKWKNIRLQEINVSRFFKFRRMILNDLSIRQIQMICMTMMRSFPFLGLEVRAGCLAALVFISYEAESSHFPSAPPKRISHLAHQQSENSDWAPKNILHFGIDIPVFLTHHWVLRHFSCLPTHESIFMNKVQLWW